MNASPPLLLSELRRCTGGRHAAIKSPLAQDQGPSRARYGDVLCGFDAFMGPWEAAVRRVLPALLQP